MHNNWHKNNTLVIKKKLYNSIYYFLLKNKPINNDHALFHKQKTYYVQNAFI